MSACIYVWMKQHICKPLHIIFYVLFIKLAPVFLIPNDTCLQVYLIGLKKSIKIKEQFQKKLHNNLTMSHSWPSNYVQDSLKYIRYLKQDLYLLVGRASLGNSGPITWISVGSQV